ncbi:MAG TPA: hypothetical protein VM571_08465 [Noviherbaspirillum sp.]|jgi:hypothetical protein|nr:hypothetical protein [Noviherbaspirillum sp.]
MSRKIFDYISCVILGLVLFGTITAVLLMFSWVPILWTDPAAAWVQAIGSIAAIAGAYLLAEKASRDAREQSLAMDRLTLQRKRDSILAIADAARAHADSIYRAFETDNDMINTLAIALVFNKRVYSDVINAIAAVPLHDLGSFQAVDSLLKIKEASVYLVEKVERAWHPADSQEIYQARPRNVRDEKASIRTSCNVVRQEYQRLAAVLGA